MTWGASLVLCALMVGCGASSEGSGGVAGDGGAGGSGGQGGIGAEPTLFAYVANVDDDNVSQYGIEADGTLSPLTPATVAAGTGPASMVVVSRLE